MSISYSIRGTPQENRLPVPNEAALAYDFVNNVLWGSSPDVGEWVALGGGPNGGPVILVSEAFVNTTSPQSINITAPAIQMYALSIYMNSLGLGSAGQTVTATVHYTAADGSGPQDITLILPLSTLNVVMETYPLLCLADTPISVTTAYQGAYDPIYTIAASIVQMPTSVQP